MSNKKRLAYISPLPPEKSGISYYSAELLTYLSQYYDITLVVDQEKVEDNLQQHFDILDVRSFVKEGKKFERVLYHFGNSPFHKHMFALLEEVPGIIVLHDMFLSDLVHWISSFNYKPGYLHEQVYNEWGIKGLLMLEKEKIEEIKKNYPLNYTVINNSIGVIVHSKHALDLIHKFYYHVDKERIAVIPHLRATGKTKKVEKKDIFYVCSFGYITPLKLSHRIIEAFGKSKLSKIDNVKLFLIGEASPDYLDEIDKLIKKLGLTNKVEITGFVDDSTYIKYLELADIAVQLRTMSRGESSGTVLDCLAAGIPTIINNHGSFSEIPDDIVIKLRDNFDEYELASALEYLYSNEKEREILSSKAINYIKINHDPSVIANLYHEAIESLYKKSVLIKFLNSKALEILNENELDKLSRIIIKNHKRIVDKLRILVDCSVVSIADLKTGIQRVVKAQLAELLKLSPPNVMVDPIRLTDEGGFWHFKSASRWAGKYFNIKQVQLKDNMVFFKKGDIYYAPDLNGGGVIEAYKAGLYDYLKLKGVKIVFLVHDLLPLEFPNYFPPGESTTHERWCEVVLKVADKVVCTTHDVATKLRKFAENRGLLREDLVISSLHLGFDFKVAPHSKGLSHEELSLFERIKSRPYFIMVGTIEPRKGHWQVLKAFEILWQKGVDYHLVFIGKIGWMVDELIRYISQHPELNKKFFFTGHISDDFLEMLYSQALASIVASEGEGFGLPIVESASYNVPVIARDIPVFREVAGDGAYYFKNKKDPAHLAEELEKWVALYNVNKHPKPDTIKFMTWEEHTKRLLDLLIS